MVLKSVSFDFSLNEIRFIRVLVELRPISTTTAEVPGGACYESGTRKRVKPGIPKTTITEGTQNRPTSALYKAVLKASRLAAAVSAPWGTPSKTNEVSVA